MKLKKYTIDQICAKLRCRSLNIRNYYTRVWLKKHLFKGKRYITALDYWGIRSKYFRRDCMGIVYERVERYWVKFDGLALLLGSRDEYEMRMQTWDRYPYGTVSQVMESQYIRYLLQVKSR